MPNNMELTGIAAQLGGTVAATSQKVEALERKLDEIIEQLHRLVEYFQLNPNPTGGLGSKDPGVGNHDMTGPGIQRAGTQPGYRYHDKIQIPNFKEGGDLPPRTWVRKLNDLFTIQPGRTDQEKVYFAGLHMEGTTYDWYQYWKDSQSRHQLTLGWEVFCNAFFIRFENTWDHDHFSQLTSLQQKGSVADYSSRFQELAPLVPAIPEDMKVELFIGKLQPAIQMELKMARPQNLDHAIQKARFVEARNEALIRPHRYVPPPMRSPAPITSKHPVTPSNYNPTSKPTFPVDNVSSERKGVKKLSPAEIEECRRKQICFWCKNPFQRGHRCPERRLYSIILEEGEEETSIDEDYPKESAVELPLEELPLECIEQPKISLQA